MNDGGLLLNLVVPGIVELCSSLSAGVSSQLSRPPWGVCCAGSSISLFVRFGIDVDDFILIGVWVGGNIGNQAAIVFGLSGLPDGGESSEFERMRLRKVTSPDAYRPVQRQQKISDTNSDSDGFEAGGALQDVYSESGCVNSCDCKLRECVLV